MRDVVGEGREFGINDLERGVKTSGFRISNSKNRCKRRVAFRVYFLRATLQKCRFEN